jgi:hypothetical protein
MGYDDVILICKPEGRRPFGISRYKLEDNIKTYLTEMDSEGVE